MITKTKVGQATALATLLTGMGVGVHGTIEYHAAQAALEAIPYQLSTNATVSVGFPAIAVSHANSTVLEFLCSCLT